MELGFSSKGGPSIPPGLRCEITKHLKLAKFDFGHKFLCRCLKFGGFEGGIGVLKLGGPLNSNRAKL